MNYKEKRIDPRINFIKPVNIKCIDSEGQITNLLTGVILDISKGGVKIESPITIESGFIIISTVDMKNKTYGIRGKIVYSVKKDSGGYLLGIKFEAPESSCTKFIKAAVIGSHFSKIHSNAKVDPHSLINKS